MSSSTGPHSGTSSGLGLFDQISAGADTTVGGGIQVITNDSTTAVFVYTSGVTLDNGDTLDVVVGGSALDTTVNSGGLLEVVQGGVALNTLVNISAVISGTRCVPG